MEFARGEAVKKFLLVALASYALDILWTLTVVATAAHDKWLAAFYSVLMVFVSGAITIEYVKTPRLLVAVALGSAAGTVVALTIIP